MAIAVRRLAVSDRVAWESLWRGYQDFYEISLTQEASDLTWSRFHDPDEPVDAFGAFDGLRLVGIAHTVLHRSCWTSGDYCLLQDLFVREDCRGSGIGRTLIDAVYRFAADRGASRVYWLTHETNEPAMRLYDGVAQKSGFIQYRKTL
jgi:GNAT superfamily N-acetyltransferase